MMQVHRSSAKVLEVKFKPFGNKNALLECKTIFDKIFNQKL